MENELRTMKFKIEKGKLSVKYPHDGNYSGLRWMWLSGYVGDFYVYSLLCTQGNDYF